MENKSDLDDKLEEAWNSPYAIVPEKVVSKSWDKFRKQLNLSQRRRSTQRLRNISIAAATLCLICTSYFFLEYYNPTITEENFSIVEREIALPDGSLVVLQHGAQLKYKKHFNKSRQVQLTGSAFFDVAKDSLKEFTVGKGTSMIRVLGTSFSVSDKKNDGMEVALYSGRVSISIEGTAESWGLIPGEKFYLSQGKAHVVDFDPNLSFEPGNAFIDVDKMKTVELLSFLEDRFGYRFIATSITSDKWATLRINKEDSLEEILDLLSTINTITYEIDEENRIIVLTEK